MTYSSSFLKLSKKEKYVSWITDLLPSINQFYKYIENQNLGKIFTLDDAYEMSTKKPFVIVGKIVTLPHKLEDERKNICKKCEPATALLIKEMIFDDEKYMFGKVFKVKLIGKIASDIESSDIHVGDRIVLISPVISLNTDYLQRPDFNPLVALLFDDSSSSVLLCAKFPIGVKMSKNKLLSHLRCSTPVSDGRSEFEVSESESVENKRQLSCKSRFLRRDVMKRNILRDHTIQNSPKKRIIASDSHPPKLTKEKSDHPALNKTVPISCKPSSPKRTIGGKLQPKSPSKPSHTALCNENEPDINIIEPVVETCQNMNDHLMTSIVNSEKKENINHNFIKIRDINEKYLNKKIDMFVVVLDVRQNEVGGKKKKCLITRVIDETCTKFKPFTVYFYYEDKKPKVEQKWILRIRHVKIESNKGIYDGRVFSPGSVVSFSPSCSEFDLEKPITLRKVPYECNDFDMNYVCNLRKFIHGKHWNLIRLMEGFYPHPPKTIKQTTFEAITDETWFSVKCEIVNVRMFFDYNVVVLTVTDGSSLQHFSYCVPKECKLWSETITSKERYFCDIKEIDIILKNVSPSFDSSALKAQNQVLINNIQIHRNKSKNLEALIFVVDISNTDSKIDLLPPVTDLEFSSETQDDSNVVKTAKKGKEENTDSFDELLMLKANEIMYGLHDISNGNKTFPTCGQENSDAEFFLSDQAKGKKKLFFKDSSNFDDFISSSESTCDLYELSKSKQIKPCSVIIDERCDKVDNVSGNSNEVNVKTISTKSKTQSSNKHYSMGHSTGVITADSYNDEDPFIKISVADRKQGLKDKNNISPNEKKKIELNKSKSIEEINENLDSFYSKSGVSSSEKERGNSCDQTNKIFIKNTCFPSFIDIIKKGKIKIPPELTTINLSPFVVMKKIDYLLMNEKKINEIGSAGVINVGSDCGLEASETELTDNNSDKLYKNLCYEKCESFYNNKRARILPENSSCNAVVNELECQTGMENILAEDSDKVESECLDEAHVCLSKHDGAVLHKGRNVSDCNEVVKKCTNNCNQIIGKKFLSDKNKTSEDVSTIDDNYNCGSMCNSSSNMKFNNRKRKICENKTNSLHKFDIDFKPLKMSTSEIINAGPENIDNVSRNVNESSCTDESFYLHISQPDFPVQKIQGRLKKHKIKKSTKDIKKILSDANPIGTFSDESHSLLHILNNNSENDQTCMKTFINDDSSSMKSECSVKSVYFSTHSDSKRHDRALTTDVGSVSEDSREMEDGCILNHESTDHASQSSRVYSWSKQVPTSSSEKVKSSSKSKISSCSVSGIKQNVHSRSFTSPPHSSVESVSTETGLDQSNYKLTDRKSLNLVLTNDNASSSQNDESLSQIEDWLRTNEADCNDRYKEPRLAENIDERDNLPESEDVIKNNENNKETESPSQSISEFIQANTKANMPIETPMSAVIVNKQMSFKAFMWDLQPKISENPLDIVSGLCENSCENFFLFSTLMFNSELEPICPICHGDGKEAEVKLQFLFELLLMIQTGHSVTALVYGDHAVKFFDCTVQQYLHDTNARVKVIQKLKYFLGAGHNPSIRYTPPFPVRLIPIGLTREDQTSVIRFCVVNTELPPVNYHPVQSLFNSQ